MSESGVELKGYSPNASSQPTTPWNSQVVGDMNPTYMGIDDGKQIGNASTVSDSTDPTTRVYDSVPGQEKARLDHPQQPQPPPPNPGRRITSNALYEPSGSTLHPQTMKKQTSYSNNTDVEEAYGDESSSGYIRACILCVLVGISLALAMVAVVLVMLLWFGVYDPTSTECPTQSTSTTEANTGTCKCPDPDLQPLIDWINEETANLTAQIERLTAQLEFYQNQNANFTAQTNSLGVAITSVNSSCLDTLDAVSDQLGSIEGLNFNAQLLNVGVFNSCVYEYLSECDMPSSTNNCTTEYKQVIEPGYFNLDLACHVGLTNVQGGVFFAPITNLRFNTTGDNFNSAEEELENSTVRCECSLVAVTDTASRKNEVFHCKLFRVRCLTVETYRTTIVT